MSPQMGEYTLEDDNAIMAAHSALFNLHALVIPKTADQIVNNSVVLVNDLELFFPIGVNEIWAFILFLLHNTTAVADIKFNVAGPAGCQEWIQQQNANDMVENQDQVGVGRGADAFMMMAGLAKNGALAGNVVIQWAQNVLEVSDTEVLIGSCLVAWQVA